MNLWLLAAAVLLVAAFGPALCVAAVAAPERRLIAQNLATVVGALAFLLMAQGYGRSPYRDAALVLAVLGPAGTLVYARFLGVLPSSRTVLYGAAIGVPAVVGPVCAAVGPGREMVKVLVIGALLVAGGTVTSVKGDRHG
ncbi:hypothetical protein FH608_008680 [Nonomuraea phyllanthi]|uniref:Uncharacterized protein n=1 Tax=Nonomuraea phyllanthi TaxID=2219224 RepID=A0A5C4WVR8_9ACTN|nr:MrpF/PhaF family protein [Nonomuraea phyllanthi]KAB8196762.1 hypothetical protein FH608_008680 [Nonomuraea phyllanthi]